MTEAVKKKVLLIGGMHFNVPKELHEHFEIMKHVEQGTDKIQQLPKADYIFVISNWVSHGIVKAAKKVLGVPVIWLRKGWNAMSVELLRQGLLDPAVLKPAEETGVTTPPPARKKAIVLGGELGCLPKELSEFIEVLDHLPIKDLEGKGAVNKIVECLQHDPDVIIHIHDDHRSRSKFRKILDYIGDNDLQSLKKPEIVTSIRWHQMKLELIRFGVIGNEDDPSRPKPKVKPIPDPDAFSRTCSQCGQGCSSNRDDLCVACQEKAKPAAPASTGIPVDELWKTYGKAMIGCVRAGLKPKEKVREADLLALLSLSGGVGLPEADLRSLLPELALRGIIENTVEDTWKLMSSDDLEYEQDDDKSPAPEARKPKSRHRAVGDDRALEVIALMKGLPLGPYTSKASLIAKMAHYREFLKPNGSPYSGTWYKELVLTAIDLKVVEERHGRVFVDHDPSVVLSCLNPGEKEVSHGV